MPEPTQWEYREFHILAKQRDFSMRAIGNAGWELWHLQWQTDDTQMIVFGKRIKNAK